MGRAEADLQKGAQSRTFRGPIGRLKADANGPLSTLAVGGWRWVVNCRSTGRGYHQARARLPKSVRSA